MKKKWCESWYCVFLCFLLKNKNKREGDWQFLRTGASWRRMALARRLFSSRLRCSKKSEKEKKHHVKWWVIANRCKCSNCTFSKPRIWSSRSVLNGTRDSYCIYQVWKHTRASFPAWNRRQKTNIFSTLERSQVVMRSLKSILAAAELFFFKCFICFRLLESLPNIWTQIVKIC